MTNVLVLGGSGMLGSMIVDVLSKDPDFRVTASARNEAVLSTFESIYPAARWVRFSPSSEADTYVFDGQQWVINAIGITKPLIRDDNPVEIENAIAINSALPHAIGRNAASAGAQVLQIATDCVYSGSKGGYDENSLHDALDVYGKSKSLGESWQPGVHHLRCSIIGPEPKDFKFLIEWFRRQPEGAKVNGFTNHNWNGVTTLQFAKICVGVMRENLTLPHLQHVIPTGHMTKAGMLHAFAAAFQRSDIKVNDGEAKTVIDRTLATVNAEMSEALWAAARYHQPPSVGEMIEELAAYPYQASTVMSGAGSA